MMRGSLSEQLAKLEGLLMPKPLHPKRHATALKIAVALHRAERATKDPHTLSALKELHTALTDALELHGPELGLGEVGSYSGGLAK